MNQLPIVLLLAQGRVSNLSQGFRARESGQGTSTLALVAICAVMLAAAVGIHLWVRYRMSQPINDKYKLFKELCRVNRLSWKQKRTLRKLAAFKGLADPTLLFVDPDLWTIDTSGESPRCKPAFMRQIVHMQRMLFRNSGTEDAVAA